ncbi:uncharacterized protein LOC113215635 [Frankliniella occidentalis]|uniref:Uncharacterized protein LOC113215635 n=1 Tax=Frankliniella occidentalis TaxID=133901 RepID=A0A9C6U3C8_FRAOC|nr:uncharacterized protein LOC113215635 [Frankliniella occidentalis]
MSLKEDVMYGVTVLDDTTSIVRQEAPEMFAALASLVLLQALHASSAADNLPMRLKLQDPRTSAKVSHTTAGGHLAMTRVIPKGGRPTGRLALSPSVCYSPGDCQIIAVLCCRLSEKGAPFDLQIRIPQLRINADYTSSGVLIIIPASGKGSFHAALAGVTAVLRGTTSTARGAGGRDFLRVDKLNVDLKIRDVNMGIKRAFNNNAILTEATNLFLRSNGHEVLEAMMPQLRLKLAEVFMSIANKLLAKVPVQYLVRD